VGLDDEAILFVCIIYVCRSGSPKVVLLVPITVVAVVRVRLEPCFDSFDEYQDLHT